MKSRILVLFVSVCLLFCGCSKKAESDGETIGDFVAAITVDENSYVLSRGPEETLPDGFEFTGTVTGGLYEGCEYYTNEKEPNWVYVKSWVGVAEESEKAFYRMVDSKIQGKKFICVNDVLYIGTGQTIETDTENGYISIGRASFSGYDTVPEGELSSNTGSEEVFTKENDDSMLFVRTTWYSKDGMKHRGFYIYEKA